MNNKKILSYFAGLLLLLVGVGGYFMWTIYSKNSDGVQEELLMGIFLVIAIAALMTLLYILAAGFSFMGLTDIKQPLGLPEGSIRAMIALILILAFIIFGFYLYRSIGDGISTVLERNIPLDSLKNFNIDKYKDLQTTIEMNKADSTFSIISVQKTSDEGYKLAQQLLTTVGTLVVAIASFYFGSTTVNSAISTAFNSSSTSSPVQPVEPPIKPIEPENTKNTDSQKDGDDNNNPNKIISPLPQTPPATPPAQNTQEESENTKNPDSQKDSAGNNPIKEITIIPHTPTSSSPPTPSAI